MVKPGWFLFAFLLFSSLCRAEVTLGTNVPEFEHFHNRGGGSLEHVRCILSSQGDSSSFRRIPWRRAHQEVASGTIDGFFTALSMNEVNKYATLSEPLVLENWYWFWRSGDSAPTSWRNGFKLGAILGSHQAVWLDEEDYPVQLRVGSLEQLVRLLLSGRIDAFIADSDHMEAAAAELGVSGEHYQRRFLRYVPLGVYFGSDFLAQNPGFLAGFNRHIYDCSPEGFVMSASEQTAIRDWLLPLVASWLDNEPLVGAAQTQNLQTRHLEWAQIETLDGQWRDEFRSGDYALAESVTRRPLSRRMRELEVDAQGLVTEIILTDARGLNVAISDMTSDYNQGDERKVSEAIVLESGQLHFDPVRYDESTRRFQVHVSRPLFDESGAVIGVLIVGVDVERALSLAR